MSTAQHRDCLDSSAIIRAVDPDALAGLLAVALSVPVLPAAACKGQTSHDPREIGEALYDFRRRHARAVEVCGSCADVGPCKQWLASLTPHQRPGGAIVAGQLVGEARLVSDAARRTQRMYELLQSNPVATNAELAARLGCDTSTVRHARKRLAVVS